MNWLKPIAVTAALLTLAGCATQKQWTPAGGSRADGTVKMGFTYGMFESPQVNEAQGQAAAASTCQGWGYDSAEAFGMVNRTCNSRGADGTCYQTLVMKEYQCTSDSDQLRRNKPEDVNTLAPVN